MKLLKNNLLKENSKNKAKIAGKFENICIHTIMTRRSKQWKTPVIPGFSLLSGEAFRISNDLIG